MRPGLLLVVVMTLPCLVATLDTRPARADAGESVRSISTGVAGFSVSKQSALGGVVGGDYEYGVTDLVWLRATAGAGWLYDFGDQSSAQLAYSEVGITYVIDVLRFVPHIDLGAGVIYLRGNKLKSQVEPLVSIGLGLDLLSSPTRSTGLFTRFESFLSKSAFFQMGVRTSWRSGFF